MQVRKLIRLLSEFIAKGHGHKDVFICKESFSHPLESDGATILLVKQVAVLTFPILSDEGSFVHDDDQEHFTTGIVLYGENNPPAEEI